MRILLCVLLLASIAAADTSERIQNLVGKYHEQGQIG